MALFKCKMCGGDLDIIEGASIAECEYCGTKQTVPKAIDENLQNLYNRANTLRIKSEFDKAEKLYEKIIQADSTQAEAYWGLILCKYGIEYVDDPATFKKVPTCHKASYESVVADDDYKAAIKNADASQRSIYENQAKEIDRIQKDILALAQKEENYDVFICYKETDANGKRTQDSVIANDIYYQLTQEGFKVFYAAITLEGKLGSSYEPIIFAALNSAKVMLAIGTKPEYFNAVWVKNEWSRYLKIVKSDRSKLLIPCYRDMDAYDLPEEFAHLQAQDMSKIGFINDVVRGIQKVIKKDEPKETVFQDIVLTSANSSTAPLLKRAFLFLEDGEWEDAYDYLEKVLDIDPECAEAYLGKLMLDLKVSSRSALGKQKNKFDSNSNYKRCIRFANDALKAEISEYLNEIVYTKATRFLNKGYSKLAIILLRQIAGYKDVDLLLEKALSNDVLALARASIDGEKWGYIDQTGTFIIQPQFEEAYDFDENGLASVKQNGKWGCINETGVFGIPPRFEESFEFCANGLAAVEQNGKWGWMDETGTFIIPPRFDNVGGFAANGISLAKQSDKWGYIDESGVFVIPPQFEDAANFYESRLARAKQNGKWGYIDESGVFVIPPQFEDADNFHESRLVLVKQNGKWGYIDQTGAFVIQPQFDDAGSFAVNGLSAVEQKGKWGYINQIGAFIIFPQFERAYDFGENGLALAKQNGKWGYIDQTGAFVIQPQFSLAYSFQKDGLASVMQNGKWGYIDETGVFVIPPQFEDLDNFSYITQTAAVMRKEKIENIRQQVIARKEEFHYQEEMHRQEIARQEAARKAEFERQETKLRNAQENERMAQENRLLKQRHWRNSGLCQHCGNQFKGFFVKTCTKCGKKKDY